MVSETNSEDLYSDDETHPIPRVGTIDVETKLESGGAYFALVIASPMHADQRSQKRLLKKLENYIGDFYSPEALKARGQPTPRSARIRVVVHPDSDDEIFELLDRSRRWVENNQITFVVDSNLGDLSGPTLN
jgi:hypothetical protein